MAVVNSEMYTSCINRNARVSESSVNIAACSKCSTKIKLFKCAKNSDARVILEDGEGDEHKITIFSETLDQVVE